MSGGVLITTVVVSSLVVGGALVAKCVSVVGPNEALYVCSGPGEYRAVDGDWAMCLPGLETVERLDLSPIALDIELEDVASDLGYDKVMSEVERREDVTEAELEDMASTYGTSVNVELNAEVKISSDERIRDNAAARFLGQPRRVIERVARETIEGNARSVIAAMTPSELAEERSTVAEELGADLEPDFQRLGLQLERLEIGRVSTVVGGDSGETRETGDEGVDKQTDYVYEW